MLVGAPLLENFNEGVKKFLQFLTNLKGSIVLIKNATFSWTKFRGMDGGIPSLKVRGIHSSL